MFSKGTYKLVVISTETINMEKIFMKKETIFWRIKIAFVNRNLHGCADSNGIATLVVFIYPIMLRNGFTLIIISIWVQNLKKKLSCVHNSQPTHQITQKSESKSR